MPPNAPRRDWHSSMIVPMYSLGVMIVHFTIGSLMVGDLAGRPVATGW